MQRAKPYLISVGLPLLVVGATVAPVWCLMPKGPAVYRSEASIILDDQQAVRRAAAYLSSPGLLRAVAKGLPDLLVTGGEGAVHLSFVAASAEESEKALRGAVDTYLEHLTALDDLADPPLILVGALGMQFIQGFSDKIFRAGTEKTCHLTVHQQADAVLIIDGTQNLGILKESAIGLFAFKQPSDFMIPNGNVFFQRFEALDQLVICGFFGHRLRRKRMHGRKNRRSFESLTVTDRPVRSTGLRGC